MWCSRCHQDVAALRGAPHESPACARCGHRLTIAKSNEPPKSEPSRPSAAVPISDEASAEDAPPVWEDRTSSAIDSLRRTLDLLDVAIDRLARETDAESEPIASDPRSVTAVPMPAFPLPSQPPRDKKRSGMMPSEAMAEAIWRALDEPLPVAEASMHRQAAPISPSQAHAEAPPPSPRPQATPTNVPRSQPQPIPASSSHTETATESDSLAQLGRKLEDIEAVLDAWRPRVERRVDSPSQRLTRHFDDRIIEPRLNSQRIGFRSQIHYAVQRLRSAERQVLLLLVANLGVFIGTALATGWSLALGVPSQASHLLTIGVVMQVATLFGLAWFVSQTRSIVDVIDDAEREYASHWRSGSSDRLMAQALATRKDGPSTPEPYGWNEPLEDRLANPRHPRSGNDIAQHS